MRALLMDLEPGGLGFGVIAATLFAAALVRGYFFVGLGVLVRSLEPAQRFAVSELPIGSRRLRSELFAGIQNFVVDGVAIALVIRARMIWFERAFSWPSFCGTLVCLFVLYELWFYALHRALHADVLYWIHRQHHQGRNPHPVTAFSFSALERAIFISGGMALTIVLSRVWPVSLDAFVLFGLIGVITGVIGHLNIELYPSGLLEFRLGRLVSTATFHALHHENQRAHYGLSSTILDRLFGTALWAEYESRWKLLHGPRTKHRLAPQS